MSIRSPTQVDKVEGDLQMRAPWFVAVALVALLFGACTTSGQRPRTRTTENPTAAVPNETIFRPDLVVYFRSEVSLDQINGFLTLKRLAPASIIDGARIDPDLHTARLHFRPDASGEAKIALREEIGQSPLVLRVE